MSEELLVNVYFDPEEEEESRAARDALASDSEVFDGCVTGMATRQSLDALRKAGISFEILTAEPEEVEAPVAAADEYAGFSSVPVLKGDDLLRELGALAEHASTTLVEARARAEDRGGPGAKAQVQLVVNESMNEALRQRLADAGADISSRQGKGSYRASVAPERVKDLEALPFVQSVRECDVSDRLGKSLRRGFGVALPGLRRAIVEGVEKAGETPAEGGLRPGTLKRVLKEHAPDLRLRGRAIDALASATQGFVGAVCQEAMAQARRVGRKTIGLKDVTNALVGLGREYQVSLASPFEGESGQVGIESSAIPLEPIRRILGRNAPKMRIARSAVSVLSIAA